MLPITAAIILLSVLIGSLWTLIHLRGRKTFPPPSKHNKKSPGLPPGPNPLPILGNLLMLGSLPHRSLQKMAQKHGPIMTLRLGNVLTVVVSSPYYAEKFLKTHDIVFASRPRIQMFEHMSYGTKGVGFCEYGPYWRNVRKLCIIELLSESKIKSFKPIRREEIEAKVKSVKKSAVEGEVVDVSEMVAELLADITCKMIFGRCRDDRFDIKGIFHEYWRLVGTFNISEYVPWLGPLDLQGLNRRMKAQSMMVDEILEALISDHEQDKSEHQSQHKDFTGLLVSLMNDHKNCSGEDSYNIDRTNVKGIMLDMLSGTMDTSASTSQWIFLNLMKHPRVMKKLQAELETVVGLGNMVEEEDLANLLYLDMVIKESLRLYPVGPLLVPHESMEEIIVNGYLIPKKTRVLVNIWTIGRDPEVWSDNAEDFYPERFESNNVDYRSQDFNLLAFGSGRRGCPGMQLGLKMIKIVMAQLVHCFEWELPMRKLSYQVDMTENFGITIAPANSLFAIPTYRLSV